MSEKKKSKFSIRKLIYNDKYLIITSIVAAIIIWIITSMNISPQTTRVITIPVTVETTSSAQEQLGLQNFGEQTINVDVTVSAKKYLIRDVSENDISVSVDTSSVVRAGSYSLDITATKTDGDFSIYDYSPKTYNGYFDVAKESAFPIDIDYSTDDFVADGYIAGEEVFNQTSALVSGASTYVNRVKSVSADVEITDKLSESKTFNLDLKALDADGNVVNYVTIDAGEENPTLTVPILKIATLPVSTTIIDRPDNVDDSAITLDYSVSEIKVGMLESELKTTDALNLGEISFNQLTVGKNKFSFYPAKINGVTVLDKTKKITVTVTVPSDFSSKKVSINKNVVDVVGLPDGYKAVVNSISANYLTVVGEDVSHLTSKNISGVVDLGYKDNDTIEESTDNYETTFTITNIDNCWIYGSYTANIKIVKQ